MSLKKKREKKNYRLIEKTLATPTKQPGTGNGNGESEIKYFFYNFFQKVFIETVRVKQTIILNY